MFKAVLFMGISEVSKGEDKVAEQDPKVAKCTKKLKTPPPPPPTKPMHTITHLQLLWGAHMVMHTLPR